MPIPRSIKIFLRIVRVSISCPNRSESALLGAKRTTESSQLPFHGAAVSNFLPEPCIHLLSELLFLRRHGKSERRFTSQRATSQRKTCRDTATRNRYARTHCRPVKTRMPARPSHSSAPKQPRRVPHLVDKKNRWGKVQTGMRESSCESSDSEIDCNGASNTEITTAPVAVSSVVRFPSPSSKPPRLPSLPSRQKGPLPQLDDGGTD